MKKKKGMFKRKILDIFFVFMILGIIVFIIIKEYNENKIGKIETKYKAEKSEIKYSENQVIIFNQIYEEDKKEIENQIENEIKVEEKKDYPKENILENYKGYKVSAKLVIPNISLETYVLDKFSIQALNTSVTKFWGPNPNEIGNFCIAGHNFKNKNMFRNLKKLEKGNEIFLIDNKIGKVKYEIYDIFQVFPDDVNCLNQNTIEKEITLITCTSDSKKRIIIKAKEVI